MRIINADELKKTLAKNTTIWTFNVNYDGILAETIDNAPTITIKEWKKEMPYYMQRAMLDSLRPQGEWISNGGNGIYNPGRHCSLCGKVVEFSENYCPQCGASMRGVNNG